MNNSDKHFVVVGGGHAAGQLLDSLRREDFDGKLTLVSEEEMLPYQRPHLSKLYLSGELPKEKLLYRPREFYEKNIVDCVLGCRVDEIDPTAKTILLSDGKSIKYDKLALTTGARVRRLKMEGTEAAGVHYLRSVSDTDSIRANLANAEKVVLIGGGFLGLEAAAVMTGMGKQVSVVEVQDRVMANAVAPAVSAFYEQVHRENGVNILTSTGALPWTPKPVELLRYVRTKEKPSMQIFYSLASASCQMRSLPWRQDLIVPMGFVLMNTRRPAIPISLLQVIALVIPMTY